MMAWTPAGRRSYRLVVVFAILSSLSLFLLYSPSTYRSLSRVRFYKPLPLNAQSDLSKVLVVAATNETVTIAQQWTSELPE